MDLTVDTERSVDIQVYITRTVKRREKLNEYYTDVPPLDDTSYNLTKGGTNGQKGIYT